MSIVRTDPYSIFQDAKNPWSDPPDPTSQMEVEQRDPKLAAPLKAVRDGVSYSLLIKQRDEREARAKIRELPYSKKEHRSNVFLIPLKEGGLKMQSASRICVSCYAEMQDDIHHRSDSDRQSEQDRLRMRDRSDDDNLKATERKAILSNQAPADHPQPVDDGLTYYDLHLDFLFL